MTTQVASQAAYAALVQVGEQVASQTVYVVLTNPVITVASQAAYMVLMEDITPPAPTVRRRPTILIN